MAATMLSTVATPVLAREEISLSSEIFNSGFERFHYEEDTFVTIIGDVLIDASGASSPAMSITGYYTLTLYIKDGARLTLIGGDGFAGLNVGSHVPLNIIGNGEIVASGGESGAGIGGDSSDGSSGTINIYSGKITATGGAGAAGIGGGVDDTYAGEGNVNIFGGNITAKGSNGGAGIGGAGSPGNGTGGDAGINIYGGNIKATGGSSDIVGGGAGIGGGGGESGGHGYIYIFAGSITASGGDGIGGGAGIGGGGGDNSGIQLELAHSVDLSGMATAGLGISGSGNGANIGDGGDSSGNGVEANLEPTFSELYTVNVSAKPGGQTFGGGVRAHFDEYENIFAVASVGYSFERWECSNPNIFFDETEAVIYNLDLYEINDNISFTAHFVKNPIPEIDITLPNSVNGGIPLAGAIVITFTETMNTAEGIVAPDSGGFYAEWDATAKIYTISYFGLEEGSDYLLELSGFISANGYASEDVTLHLTTGIAANTTAEAPPPTNNSNTYSRYSEDESPGEVLEAEHVIQAARLAKQNDDPVILRNIGDISKEALAEIASILGSSTALTVDNIEGSAVQVRVTVDLNKVSESLNLIAATNGTSVDFAVKIFEKWYANQVKVISFGQKAPWGQVVRIAARLDLTDWDVEKLVFYSYDAARHSYKRIAEPDYWIDQKGYLHFKTEYAGCIVVSEGELALR